MADYGAKIADKAIENTEKKIRAVYQKAAKELSKKLSAFNKRFAKQQKEMLEKLEKGLIDRNEYAGWLRRQVFRQHQWTAKADQATRIMLDANKEASQLVKKGRLNVFAENYNYAAYQLEKQARGAVNFSIYNEKAVEKLLRKKPKMLPEWKIDEPKDYKWNRQKVENSVTQGIIQGKRIDEITSDLVSNLCTTNDNKMRTFARTAMTGAQNAGRQAQMEDAEDMGIKVKKKWVAVLDSRTRDTHQRLDGQEVDIDEPFKIDDYEIDYPGDPNGDPEMVYNCRCTMIQIYPGIERHSTRRAYDDDENGERDTKHSYLVQDMTYLEWKEWKERGKR
jgi:SPP1 gp7 family putative phage head morphogenesis protein